ncbi:MAG TPA: PEGA domain-containing protein, partial [Myxococcales bacterium]|nr:PEGA domain-containing protein [Myxococcales bacterium]
EPPLIAVSSDPAGARIYLDGNLVGTTPVKLRATPGQHEVKLALDGYVPRVTRPNIPADRDFEMRVTAILKPVRGVEQKQHAPTVDELYQAQVQSAHAAYVKGDLEGALSGYRSAYQYKPDPRVLFNIAQMRRKLGRFEEAATTYRDFIGQADKKKKGATQKELLAEAKRQLAACEAKLVPSLAEAPVPEDTTPPRLQHEPVRSALRGHSLRVLADVTDDRSGVGSVEACWRNAFGRDFECHAMGNVSGDRYGIEVPARVVTDGFAYYLQAYDNADNGPARSGAPELPYAVLIEEPAAPQVTAAVEAALAGKVAAAPQATVADFKPSAGAPPPAADRIASPANLTTGGARPGPWTLTARLGGARSTESSYTDSALVGRAGIEASRWFGDWFTAMSFDFRSYHQQYVPANSTTGERVQVDESRYDLGLSGGYDLGPRIVESGKLELTPFAAFQYVTVRNTGFPFEVVGPGGGLRAGWTIAPFTLRAAFGYTYNLAKDSTGSSTFKAPTSTFSGLAGLEARLTPNWAVELDYLFDGIQFDQVTRVAHGGALGFSTSF